MDRQGCIAVLNAGSSSIKFALHGAADEMLLFRGQVESIGSAPYLTVRDPAGATIVERRWSGTAFDHAAATQEIVRVAQELLAGKRVVAVGHRVVHGGTRFAAPMRVDDGLIVELETLVPLAPLHQQHNLAPIRAIMAHTPHLPQVACFDTGFHAGQSMAVRSFALPRVLTAEGVQRYGFHGLSYEYVVAALTNCCAGDCPGTRDYRASRQRSQPVRGAGRKRRSEHNGFHRR